MLDMTHTRGMNQSESNKFNFKLDLPQSPVLHLYFVHVHNFHNLHTLIQLLSNNI